MGSNLEDSLEPIEYNFSDIIVPGRFLRHRNKINGIQNPVRRRVEKILSYLLGPYQLLTYSALLVVPSTIFYEVIKQAQ